MTTIATVAIRRSATGDRAAVAKGCPGWPARAMKPPSASWFAPGVPSGGGTSAGSELVPGTRTAMRVDNAGVRGLLAGVLGPKTLRDSRLWASRSCRSDGAVCRPRACALSRWAESGRERPRCRVARAAPGHRLWGRSRPAVSMSDEARMQSSSSGESPGETGIGSSTFRSRALGARRRPSRPGACALGAAPCKVLRCAPTARGARLARDSVESWMVVAVSERETLTAPLSERVTLAIT
jgi:hypothetical protein